MDFAFVAELIEWRGPAPFFFLPVPARRSAEIRELAPAVSYGWGVIPVRATTGSTGWSTSLFPRDGVYLVPVKSAVRRAEALKLGDPVELRMTLGR